jgi:hypothetical protein
MAEMRRSGSPAAERFTAIPGFLVNPEGGEWCTAKIYVAMHNRLPYMTPSVADANHGDVDGD